MKTNMLKTSEEVKQDVIKKLEDLITDIKTNKIADNYCFEWQLMERYEDYVSITDIVRFSVIRREYFRKEQSEY